MTAGADSQEFVTEQYLSGYEYITTETNASQLYATFINHKYFSHQYRGRLYLGLSPLNSFFKFDAQLDGRRSWDGIPDSQLGNDESYSEQYFLGDHRADYLEGFNNFLLRGAGRLRLFFEKKLPLAFLPLLGAEGALFYEYNRDTHYADPTYQAVVLSYTSPYTAFIAGENRAMPQLNAYDSEQTAISHNLKISADGTISLFSPAFSLRPGVEYWYYQCGGDPLPWKNDTVTVLSLRGSLHLESRYLSADLYGVSRRAQFTRLVSLDQRTSDIGLRLSYDNGRHLRAGLVYSCLISRFDDAEWARNNLLYYGPVTHFISAEVKSRLDFSKAVQRIKK